MRANVDATRGYLMSEPVMRVLADKLGKHTAHEIIYDAALRGRQGGQTLRDALLADRRVTDHVTTAEIDHCLDPINALGAVRDFIDRALAEAGHRP
jgi:adenylosuccinate lyase